MKILFLLGGLDKGGAERVVCNLANYFVLKSNQVYIFPTKIDKIAYSIDQKVNIIELEQFEGKNYKSITRNIKIIKQLKKEILNCQPDIIISFLQEPPARIMILKFISRKIRKIPVIISVRIDPKKAFNSCKRKLSLLLYKYAEGFVFQTSEAKNFFCKAIQKRSTVIGNPLDPHFFEKNNWIKVENKIVSVGRLTEQKNYPLLIKAFQIVSNKLPDYTLEIYGDGDLKGSLIELTTKLKINDKVLFKGNVDNIKEKLETATLFVISSDYEGMSNALMEAMAIGLPCISTMSSGGGASTLISDKKNGILVPTNDVEALSKAIINVLSNSDMRKELSKNAAESMKKYHPDVINNIWYDYIEKVKNKE